MAVSWIRARLSALMVVNKGLVVHRYLESLDDVVIINSDHHGVGLPDDLRNEFFCRLGLLGQHLLTDRIDGLVFELIANFNPTEIFSHSRARRIEAIPGRNGEDDRISIDAGAIGRGRFVDKSLCFLVWLTGFRNRLRAENGVVKLPIVRNIARSLRQVVHPGP